MVNPHEASTGDIAYHLDYLEEEKLKRANEENICQAILLKKVALMEKNEYADPREVLQHDSCVREAYHNWRRSKMALDAAEDRYLAFKMEKTSALAYRIATGDLL